MADALLGKDNEMVHVGLSLHHCLIFAHCVFIPKKEQKAGRCFNNVSLSIQQNAAWIIAPTNIIPLFLFTLFSLVNMISYVCQI